MTKLFWSLAVVYGALTTILVSYITESWPPYIGFFGAYIVGLLWATAPITPVGTKSLLYGVHQFAWHPFTVRLAWVRLYKISPNWKTCVCIVIHDWGYWGCNTMDGVGGREHPRWAARIAGKWFGQDYYHLCLWHSRYLAKKYNGVPSALCWADKYSMLSDPVWFYLIRARLSGEIEEYHKNAVARDFIAPWHSERQWLLKLRTHLAEMSKKEISSPCPPTTSSS